MKLYILHLFIGFLVPLCTGEQRIAGGHETSLSQYPFVVALLTNSGVGAVFTHACVGTILTSNAVLSAASCFVSGTITNPPRQWRVRAGSNLSNGGGSILLVNRITPHQNFNSVTRNNDIAVLRTSTNINLQPGVAEPAQIAGTAYTFVPTQSVWGVGWGATAAGGAAWSDHLRHVEIFVVDQQTCANRYSDIGVPITTNMVCVGWLDVGVRGQCEGDHGGPLVVNGIVVGVFSYTRSCADYWYPAINTRVPNYTGWIVNTALAP